jgi:hypothetical protein
MVKLEDAQIQPSDDLVHAPGPEPLWREGYYFEFCDPATGRFGYVNIGKLPNKGRSGYLVGLWDPEHGLLVGQDRDTFEAHTDTQPVGGLSVTCVEPFTAWNLSFAGDLVRVPRIGERRYQPPVEIPEADRVTVPTRFDITWRAVTPPHAFDSSRRPEWRNLFLHHHEQLGASSGSVQTDDFSWSLDGWTGARDHTWGPRDWMKVDTWRWVAMVFENSPHVSLWQLWVDGSEVLDGAMYTDDRAVALTEYHQEEELTPSTDGTPPEPKSVKVKMRSQEGEEIEVVGEIRVALPMKFRDRRRPGRIHWNDRCIVELDGPQGRGIGTIEFVSFIQAPDEG